MLPNGKLACCILLRKRKLPPLGWWRTNYSMSTRHLYEPSEIETYKEAVSTMNLLVNRPKESNDSNNLQETWKYLYRSGITARDLDTLSVIHVAGTKGKSSACAISESVLRSYGCKTGFFSTPHFVSVTERYHINGRPISEKYFAKMFWKLYNTLERYKEYAGDMPTSFKFLTILGFHIFFDSNVDVAIIEAGIGGLYDSTNIIRNSQTIGITSIGMDHSSVLGRNIEDVATHAAGIIKPYSNVFIVPMDGKLLNIFENKAQEKSAQFFVVPDVSEYSFDKMPTRIRIDDVSQNVNSSLGIQLAYDWLRRHRSGKVTSVRSGIVTDASREVIKGIDSCHWPGMSQIAKIGNKQIYMNGAENLSSIKACAQWFRRSIDSSKKYQCLIFNPSLQNDVKNSLEALASQVNFEAALFVPDIHYHNQDRHIDCDRSWSAGVVQIEMAENCAKYWSKISNSTTTTVKHFTSVLDAFLFLDKFYPDIEFDILVTGTMSVVGATRRALDRYKILTL